MQTSQPVTITTDTNHGTVVTRSSHGLTAAAEELVRWLAETSDGPAFTDEPTDDPQQDTTDWYLR